jgi:YfiH family protein
LNYAHPEAMMLNVEIADETRFITIPRWSRIPSLVHGFGLAGWTAEDIGRRWPDLTLVVGRQVHSERVNFIDSPPPRPPVGDALATDRPGLLLAVKTADCLPILLADPERRIVAAVHCGWRGTVQRLSERTVAALHDRYGAEPGSLLAALGPCIGRACYEVGEDVRRRFAAAGLPLDVFTSSSFHPGRYLLDLQAANRFQLLHSGLEPGRMNFIIDCTHCRPAMSSFRREGDKAGRMLAFVGLAF